LFKIFATLYANQNKVHAQIENHYFYNKCFLETDNWILENIEIIKDIPGIILQGQRDQIYPWENAAELHACWPNSAFLLIPNAGHSSREAEIKKALIQATEDIKIKLRA